MITAIKIPNNSNGVIVEPNDSIQEKYDWLKSSNRDSSMGTLSSANWRSLLLTPGTHTSNLVMDIDYISISSISSNPLDTVVTSSSGNTITQTCQYLSMTGITVHSSSTTTDDHGFVVNVIDNDGSSYFNCRYRHDSPRYAAAGARYPVFFEKGGKGLWVQCIADDYSWRCANGIDFAGTWYDCEAGQQSFAGDNEGASAGTGEMNGCIMYRCISRETGSFGSCALFGVNITSDSYFYDCIGGTNAFGLGRTNAGNFYNCHGGDNSFGGTSGTVDGGVFSGYAKGCTATRNSFGASNAFGAGEGLNSGVMDDCIVTGMTDPIRCVGATFRNCRLAADGFLDKDVIQLRDSNTVIYNCDLITIESGTGIPINDNGSAWNVVAVHCRMNNAGQSATGLGINVTNLITTPYNIVDSNML